MKLWTIQPIAWYERLCTDGIIYGEESLISNFDCQEFRNAYQWLVRQMERDIGNKPFDNAYPIWAWYQYTDMNHRRPDLRYSGFLPKGTKGVRIEFEKSDHEVLLSDFILWTNPLNFWYIADSEIEQDAFYKKLALHGIEFSELNSANAPDFIREEIEKSWDKVLDMSYCPEHSAYPFEKKSIQATFWHLSVDEIIKVDNFVAR